MASALDEWPAAFDRGADDGREIERLHGDVDHAAGDARDLEQIVDKAHQEMNLALHHLDGFRHDALRPAAVLEEVQAGE